MSESILNLVNPQRSAPPASLQIDVIADFVCPWSRLGKQRMDAALASVYGPVEVTWYPFQLNPEMPAGGLGLDEYLTSKFGGREAVAPALAQLTATARADGIDFDFDRISRVPNTVDAHRLMKLAAGSETQSRLAAELYDGFFDRGLDIGNRDVLMELAATAGLERERIARTLDDERTREGVLAAEAQARKAGVTGTPNFLVNKRLFVVGAQSTDTLLSAFDRAMFGEESDQPVSETVH